MSFTSVLSVKWKKHTIALPWLTSDISWLRISFSHHLTELWKVALKKQLNSALYAVPLIYWRSALGLPKAPYQRSLSAACYWCRTAGRTLGRQPKKLTDGSCGQTHPSTFACRLPFSALYSVRQVFFRKPAMMDVFFFFFHRWGRHKFWAENDQDLGWDELIIISFWVVFGPSNNSL